MWRQETGIIEMLFTYIGDYQTFSGWRSWRSILEEILSCHEDSRRQNIFQTPTTSIAIEESDNKEEVSLRSPQETRFLYPFLDFNRKGNKSFPHRGSDHKLPSVQTKTVAVEKEDADKNSPINDSSWLKLPNSENQECDPDLIIVKVEDEREAESIICSSTMKSVYSDDIPVQEVKQDLCGTADYRMPASNSTDLSTYEQAQYSFHTMTSESSSEFDVPNPGARNCKTDYQSMMPRTCSICGKMCPDARSLKLHHRIHSGERPYKCTWCPKRFKFNSNRTVHERIHTGKRPYVCETCGRAFTQSNSLNRHISLHCRIKS